MTYIEICQRFLHIAYHCAKGQGESLLPEAEALVQELREMQALNAQQPPKASARAFYAQNAMFCAQELARQQHRAANFFAGRGMVASQPVSDRA